MNCRHDLSRLAGTWNGRIIMVGKFVISIPKACVVQKPLNSYFYWFHESDSRNFLCYNIMIIVSKLPVW